MRESGMRRGGGETQRLAGRQMSAWRTSW